MARHSSPLPAAVAAPARYPGSRLASLWLALCLSTLPGLAADTTPAPASTTPNAPAAEPVSTILVVVGAAGEEEFGRGFVTWAGQWEKAAKRAEARFQAIGIATNAPSDDRTLLQEALRRETTNTVGELWVVLLGHGTFDGREARFNLRGPDFTATEFADWLKPMTRALAVIDASSSSGPFLNKLSTPGRVVITATRSGHEANYARFGDHLSSAIADPAADLDKDGQTSLLEAFLMGSRRVAEFYKAEGRLATEHPLIDDNGDGQGTPPDWFRGVRAVKSAKDGAKLDGLRAHQFHLIRNDEDRQLAPAVRARRDSLENAISRLRDQRKTMTEEAYYAKLEELLIELARLYEARPAAR